LVAEKRQIETFKFPNSSFKLQGSFLRLFSGLFGKAGRKRPVRVLDLKAWNKAAIYAAKQTENLKIGRI
jgi:hypothetical protein